MIIEEGGRIVGHDGGFPGISSQRAYTFAVMANDGGMRHPKQVRRLVVRSGAYAHDGWWPDAEASFHTMTADFLDSDPTSTPPTF